MEIQKQVCSLELSKKLKELGVEQESEFFWAESNFVSLTPVKLLSKHTSDHERSFYAAFTVAELGLKLPNKTITWKAQYGMIWFCKAKVRHYVTDKSGLDLYPLSDGAVVLDAEANAKAKALIYLIEEHQIDATQLN